jgi:hypothetical protein
MFYGLHHYFTHENHEDFFLQFLVDFDLCAVWLLCNILFKLKLGAKYVTIVCVRGWIIMPR